MLSLLYFSIFFTGHSGFQISLFKLLKLILLHVDPDIRHALHVSACWSWCPSHHTLEPQDNTHNWWRPEHPPVCMYCTVGLVYTLYVACVCMHIIWTLLWTYTYSCINSIGNPQLVSIRVGAKHPCLILSSAAFRCQCCRSFPGMCYWDLFFYTHFCVLYLCQQRWYTMSDYGSSMCTLSASLLH